jgi:hypothetical protein
MAYHNEYGVSLTGNGRYSESTDMFRPTIIYRSCSDVPITDGCEYYPGHRWSCIKTCKTDKCNIGSDGMMLTPSGVVEFAVLGIAAFVGRRSLF